MRGNPGPQVGALLGHGARDGRALHFALIVDDDSGVVLEVEERSVFSSEGLPLSDDDGRHDLLAELGLALLHGGEHHVAGCGRRKSVQSAANAAYRDDVQVLGACNVYGLVSNFWVILQGSLSNQGP